MRKVDVSPTSLRIKYATGLKERKLRIVEKKSITQTEQTSQEVNESQNPQRFSRYENDPVFKKCLKNLTPIQTPIVSSRASPMPVVYSRDSSPEQFGVKLLSIDRSN